MRRPTRRRTPSALGTFTGTSAAAVVAVLVFSSRTESSSAVEITFDGSNATCPENPTGRRFHSEDAGDCDGYRLLFELRSSPDPVRRVDVVTCRSDGVLTIQLADGAENPPSASFTAGETDFFANLAESIEAGADPPGLLGEVESNEAQSFRMARLLSTWPPNVPVSYVYDAAAAEAGSRQSEDITILGPGAAPGNPPAIGGARRRLDDGDGDGEGDASYQSTCASFGQWLPSAGSGMHAKLTTDPPCQSTADGMYMYNAAVSDEWQCLDPGPPHVDADWAYGNCFGMCGSGCEGRQSAVSGWGQFTLDCADYDFCGRFGIGADGTAAATGCRDEFLGTVDDTMWSGYCDEETGEEVGLPSDDGCQTAAPIGLAGTDVFTAAPTEQPSDGPSKTLLSEGPSMEPTEDPTTSPSEGPSAGPSGMPSFLSDSEGGNANFPALPPELTVRCIIALQGVFPTRNRRALSEASDESTAMSEGDEGNRRSLGGVEPYLGEIAWFAGDFAPRGWAECNGQLLSIAQNTALFSILGITYGGDGRVTFGLPDLRGRVIHHDGQGPGLASRLLGQKVGSEEISLTAANLPAHNHPDSNGQTSPTGLGQSFSILPPYQAAKCIIAIQGIFPSRNRRVLYQESEDNDAERLTHRALGGTESFLGGVAWFGGNFPPSGWAECNGQILSIAQNSALFSLLGTTYGGDGQTTFALPEARGRMVIHKGRGPALTDRHLGDKSGDEIQSLVTSNLPSHDHASPNVDPVGDDQEFSIMPPFLTLNAVIALQGIFPSRNRRAAAKDNAEDDLETEGDNTHHRSLSGSEPLLGEIMWVAFNFSPRGWAFCDGQLLPINQNQALFSILGTIYGGDGRTTFALPDLRGRAVTHAGNGPGLTDRAKGERFGDETHVLSVAEMPAHTHYAN